MKEKFLKTTLQNRAEQIAPGSEIDLWPAICKHFTSYHAVLPYTEGGSKMKGLSRNMKVLIPVFLAVILAVSFVAFTPLGKVLANTVVSFFTTTDETSFPVSNETRSVPDDLTKKPDVISAIQEQDCEGAALLSYQCQIASAEAAVGFDIWELPADPQGVSFTSIEVFSTQREVKITYDVTGGGGWLVLRQGIGEMVDGQWAKVPAEAVEEVMVGELSGEYVRGLFTSDGSGEATWNHDASSQRLRWSNGERWFSIEKNGDTVPIEYLGKEELISLATSLVKSP